MLPLSNDFSDNFHPSPSFTLQAQKACKIKYHKISFYLKVKIYISIWETNTNTDNHYKTFYIQKRDLCGPRKHRNPSIIYLHWKLFCILEFLMKIFSDSFPGIEKRLLRRKVWSSWNWGFASLLEGSKVSVVQMRKQRGTLNFAF